MNAYRSEPAQDAKGVKQFLRVIRPALRATAVALLASCAGLAAVSEAAAADPEHAAGTRRSAHPPRPAHPAPARRATDPPTRPADGGLGRRALAFALAQIGKPYVFDTAGPLSYDCSGLAQRAWAAAGIRIPRTTRDQARFGTAVPMSRIRPGDLVFFFADASHVGVYAGDGNVVVAPRPGRRVMIQQLRWMPVYGVRRPD